MTEINLKKFDMKSLKDNSVIALIAKRRSGKSFLCRDILYHHRGIPAGIVICPTEKANQFYGDFVPNLFIHDDYKECILDKLLKRQSILKEKVNKGSDIDNRAFLIMDDCMYDNKWTKDKCIQNIFMNGRHYNLLFILLMQFPLGIPPSLRTNIDYVFLLKETITGNKKRLYEHYAGMFPSLDIFSQVLDNCTENFEALVIDNTTRSAKIEDQVFWYKAVERSEFRLGSSKFWKYHKKRFNFNPKYQINTTSLLSKNKFNVTVNKISNKKKKENEESDRKIKLF